uniref:Uncharacterized protein n=1 Tax=Plectus sambesii TaxID=2011161 RepID=A0A914UPI1_9BILA
MALCETILESAVGITNIADYLLFYLNSRRDFDYVELLKLSEPCDDITKVLFRICQQFDLRKEVVVPGEGRQERWDFDSAATQFVYLFRKHKLSDHCLDADELLYG